MLASQVPSKIPLPFATSGTKNTIPETTSGILAPGNASFDVGFPPVTMLPVVSGGIPPYGADFNGILFDLASIARWANAGGFYKYDATFSGDANVGGYPNGAVIQSSDGLSLWLSTADNNTTNPDATDGSAANWVPLSSYGITTVSGLTNTNVTLLPDQAKSPIIILTGTLTGNVQILFPTYKSEWLVINNTTGAFTITCKTVSGTGGTVPQSGGQQTFYGDGTNLIPIGADNRYALLSSVQQLSLFTTAGSTPVFTLTPTSPLASYTTGTRYNVQFNASGTYGSNTINVSGLGNKNLKQYDLNGVKQPAVIYSGMITDIEYDGTDFVVIDAIASFNLPMQSITAAVSANALTGTFNAPSTLSFRNATLTNGAPVSVSIASNLTLTVPSTATLGTIASTSARLIWLIAYNGGTPVLCVTNLAGGLNLDETTLISPTTISTGATSVSVIYSASTVSANSPFRVVGFSDVTETTPGTWATGPTTVQGIGGNNLSAFGGNQTWVNQTGSRALSTTYVNARGESKKVSVQVTNSTSAWIIATITTTTGSSVNIPGPSAATGQQCGLYFDVPAGCQYSIALNTGTPTLVNWSELG